MQSLNPATIRASSPKTMDDRCIHNMQLSMSIVSTPTALLGRERYQHVLQKTFAVKASKFAIFDLHACEPKLLSTASF